ncbi:hypothetical protein F5I97DRAFT_1965359 [Phlebopus sp. FC_14]|nr:hypothetical protein F5I97DRAFT_1965359 [Phlebopus sp. FC_14]
MNNEWPNCDLDLRGLDPSTLDMPVCQVWIDCTQPTDRTTHHDMVNHWRLFFALSDRMSISLDMLKAGHDEIRGVLDVTGRHYSVSNTGLFTIPMENSQDLTVRKVLDLLRDNYMLYYDYSPTRVGCRYWILRVVDLLRRRGFLRDIVGPNYPLFDEAIHDSAGDLDNQLTVWNVVHRDHLVHSELTTAGEPAHS